MLMFCPIGKRKAAEAAAKIEIGPLAEVARVVDEINRTPDS